MFSQFWYRQTYFFLFVRFQPEIVSTLKRTAEAVLDKGGIIRKLENLGTRPLPHKISEHGVVHRTGSYFTIYFDSPADAVKDLNEEYGRDIDIIRRRVFKLETEPEVECTLSAELLPPAYRKDVQKLIHQAKKKEKPKYNMKMGLDFYPFQR